MAHELLDSHSSVPEKGDWVVVDLGAQKLPAQVQVGTVEGRNQRNVLVRLPPLFNQTRSRLLKVDVDDTAVVLSESERKSRG